MGFPAKGGRGGKKSSTVIVSQRFAFVNTFWKFFSCFLTILGMKFPEKRKKVRCIVLCHGAQIASFGQNGKKTRLVFVKLTNCCIPNKI